MLPHHSGDPTCHLVEWEFAVPSGVLTEAGTVTNTTDSGRPRTSHAQDPMSDPVTAADGHTYERSAITDWLEHHNTSPLTRMRLGSKALFPNRLVRAAVAAAAQLRVLLEDAGGAGKEATADMAVKPCAEQLSCAGEGACAGGSELQQRPRQLGEGHQEAAAALPAYCEAVAIGCAPAPEFAGPGRFPSLIQRSWMQAAAHPTNTTVTVLDAVPAGARLCGNTSDGGSGDSGVPWVASGSQEDGCWSAVDTFSMEHTFALTSFGYVA